MTRVTFQGFVVAVLMAMLAGGLVAASCDAQRTARAAIGRCS